MSIYKDFASYGFDEVTATESGNWFAVVPVGGSATFTLTTAQGDNLSSTTVAEGVAIYGEITQVAVSSGTVLAYRDQ